MPRLVGLLIAALLIATLGEAAGSDDLASPELAAAATAAFQSGTTPSCDAAKENDDSPATKVTGRSATRAYSASSLAVAVSCVMPPMSTPATCVPSASFVDEPAYASPTRTMTTRRTPAATASVQSAERPLSRRRTLDANRGESARTEPKSLAASGSAPSRLPRA